MNYRSEIDGFRALAVIPVILFHAGFNTFSGGFFGDDIFIVIPEINSIQAYVLERNERSQHLFLNAGYEVESTHYLKRI